MYKDRVILFSNNSNVRHRNNNELQLGGEKLRIGHGERVVIIRRTAEYEIRESIDVNGREIFQEFENTVISEPWDSPFGLRQIKLVLSDT